MKKVYDKCCGIDVYKKLIVSCFIHSKEREIRGFGATTRELLKLADWLAQGGCQMVAMESTASYRKPLYNIWESSGLNAMVVNARHIKIPIEKILVESDGPFSKVGSQKFKPELLINEYESIVRFFDEPDLIKIIYNNFPTNKEGKLNKGYD